MLTVYMLQEKYPPPSVITHELKHILLCPVPWARLNPVGHGVLGTVGPAPLVLTGGTPIPDVCYPSCPRAL